MNDTISIERASDVDLEWYNDGTDPDGGLRIVTYHTAGNGSRLVLCIPGDGNAPRYEYKRHNPETGEYRPAYYHVSGPTLDEWLMQAEYADAAETTAGLLSF